MAEIDPNLFETDFNLYVKKSEQKVDLVNDKNQINYHMLCRVDSRHFDKVMNYLAPISKLQQHNIESRDDWVESVMEQVKSKLTFDAEFKDHQIKLKISGKIVATFANVKLTTFQFDPTHTNLTFHLVAYNTTGGEIGKVIDAMAGNFHAAFKRAEHWSKQEGLGLEKQEDGDAGKQQELTPEQKKNVERSKDVANKRNTDKVRGREQEQPA